MIEYTKSSAGTAPVYSKSYVYAGSRLLSTATNNGTSEIIEYEHPDRLGTKLITNPASPTQYEQATLPFGTKLAEETTGTINQLFTSYDRSSITGLDNAVSRTYSSGQGRFTQVDPIGMGAASKGNPQSNNLYAYTGNNPVDFSDPSGLNAEAPESRGQSGMLYSLWYGNNIDGWKFLGSWFVPNGDDGGGEGGEGGGIGHESPPASPPKETVEQALTRCGNDMGVDIDAFRRSTKGKGGSARVFLDEGSSNVSGYEGLVGASIKNDVSSFNSKELQELGEKDQPQDGMTFGRGNFNETLSNGRNVKMHVDPFKNFTANNQNNSLAILASQVHELGNSIYQLFGKRLPLSDDRIKEIHAGDGDAGAAFEDCVFGGRINKNGILLH